MGIFEKFRNSKKRVRYQLLFHLFALIGYSCGKFNTKWMHACEAIYDKTNKKLSGIVHHWRLWIILFISILRHWDDRLICMNSNNLHNILMYIYISYMFIRVHGVRKKSFYMSKEILTFIAASNNNKKRQPHISYACIWIYMYT